jgi:hypothetical protein
MKVTGASDCDVIADLHMAQPNVPVSRTGHFPPARLEEFVSVDVIASDI